jgi:WD40 repeat protein
MNFKINFLLFLFTNIAFVNGQTASDSSYLIMPFGHTSSINDFSINSDGSNMVTVGFDKKIIIWDLNTNKEITSFIGHTDNINTVDYSFDGLKIVTGSWDNTLKVWDAKNGKLIQTLVGHSEHPDKVFFMNTNNDRVISVCNARGQKEVFIWDLKTGNKIYQFVGDIAILNKREDILFVGNSWEDMVSSFSLKTGEKLKDYIGLSYGDIKFSGAKSIIYCLSTDQTDNRLIAAGGDGSPIVWDIKTGKQLLKLEGHKSRVFSAGFSQNGAHIFTAGDDDQIIKIWNSKSGKLLFEFKDSLAGSIRSALFSSDDKYFAFVSSDYVKVFEMNNLKKIKEVPIKGFYDSKLSLTSNSRWFAVSCEKSVNYYDFDSGNLIKELKGLTVNTILNTSENTHLQSSLDCYISVNNFIFNIRDPSSMQFVKEKLIYISPDENIGWVWQNKNEVLEVKLPSFEIINKISLSQTAEILSIKIQLSEKYIFLEYNDSIHIYNRSNNNLVIKIPGQKLALSSKPDIIGVTTNQLINEINYINQNDILIWNIDSKDTLYYNKENNYTTSLHFSADSKYFLSLSEVGPYYGFSFVYDLEQGTIIDTIGIEIPHARFTNKNNVLYSNASSFDDRNNPIINIRDFINHNDIGTIKGVNPTIDWAEKYYAATSNNTIQVFSEKDYLLKASFTGHTDVITDVMFNSKNNKLISSSLDNQTIIWDIERECEIYRLIILEDNNWIIRLPNSPYYMSSTDALNQLNCVDNKTGVCDMKAYNLKYNRPDIVLDTIGKFFQE